MQNLYLILPVVVVLAGTLYATSLIQKARRSLSQEEVAQEQSVLRKGAWQQLLLVFLLIGSFVVLKQKYGDATWLTPAYFGLFILVLTTQSLVTYTGLKKAQFDDSFLAVYRKSMLIRIGSSVAGILLLSYFFLK